MFQRLLIWLHVHIGRMVKTEYPERLVTFHVSHPTIGDGSSFASEVFKALNEMADEYVRVHHHGMRSRLEDVSGTYEASNGVVVCWVASTMEGNAR